MIRSEKRGVSGTAVVGYFHFETGVDYFAYNFIKISSYTAHESSYGRWRHRSAVERRGFGCSLRSLRAAEGGKSGNVKRSLSKRMALTGWAVGSVFAVLFSCLWIVYMFYIRKVTFGLVAAVAVGIVAAWEGFKTFRSERNSK